MTNGAAGSPGIRARTYKSGSIIYFENDKSEYIYILKSGRVVLTSIKPDTGEEVKDDVRQGEFFGVKSSLGKYPREETAQTIGETVVLIMNLSDFERLILKNVNVVRKMLRVFSNQLRRIVKMNRSVLGESDTIKPDYELYRIGEYYYNAGMPNRAQYALKRYMEYYPDGEYARDVMDKIHSIDSGEAPTGEMNIPVQAPAPAPGRIVSDDSDLSDFSLDVEPEGESQTSGFDASGDESISSEMDDFLSDDSIGDNLDDFSFDENTGGGQKTYIVELYNDAADLMEQNSYSEALELLDQILQSVDQKNPDEQKCFENALYQSGLCQLNLGNRKEAFAAFGRVIKDFPQSDFAKNSLYNIAGIFEAANQRDKALAYYTRVLNMPPKDDISQQAFSRIKKLQNG